MNKTILTYTKARVPAFFKYAKQKEDNQVEPTSNSVVDRLHTLFPKTRLNFNFKYTTVGKLDYQMLMNKKLTASDSVIIKKFTDIVSALKFNQLGEHAFNNYSAVLNEARNEMLSLGISETDIVDNLVCFLFKEKKKSKKKAFWKMYEDIVYENLKENLARSMGICQTCGKRFYKTRTNAKNCPSCCSHKKVKVRKIVCVDCGKEFVVSSRAHSRIRCDECTKEHKARLNRERVAKHRKCNAPNER